MKTRQNRKTGPQRRHDLKGVTIASGLLTEEQFDEYVDPATMIYPNVK